jgi:hypothetical protein
VGLNLPPQENPFSFTESRNRVEPSDDSDTDEYQFTAHHNRRIPIPERDAAFYERYMNESPFSLSNIVSCWTGVVTTLCGNNRVPWSIPVLQGMDYEDVPDREGYESAYRDVPYANPVGSSRKHSSTSRHSSSRKSRSRSKRRTY